MSGIVWSRATGATAAAAHRERRERGAELLDRLIPPRRILLQAALDHRDEQRRHPRRGQRRRLVRDPHRQVDQRLAGERRLAGGELAQDHAERPDVAARVARLRRAQLLRRHVVRRAHDVVGAGEVAVLAMRLGDAEVEHLDEVRAVGTLGEEQIARLEVAMDDAERVGLGERTARLRDVARRDGDRDRATRAQQLRQVATVEPLHHDERRAVVGAADVEHPAHVLVLELRRGARLAQEPLDGDRLVDETLGEQLQRHRRAQVDVLGREHRTHPATADHALDAVLARDQRARLVHAAILTRR